LVDAHLGFFPTFHLPLVLGLAGELTLEELKESPEEVREQLKEVAGTEDGSADTLRREKNTCKNRVADCCLIYIFEHKSNDETYRSKFWFRKKYV